ncbi:phage repressor protein [Leptobacterium flavescens]|uniref:Phage repressor protein n=1 Tax=Leptobacterium flavescens TaxID=472055 RepID=A0A6P0UMM2_9FLAO|nr:phage repressor protein [Leptobacterium flavescens]NER14267.1 phage repressor protein [Leptobacterium flavescens]
MNWKIQKLMNGETIVSKEPGNSMLPILKSKQSVVLQPVSWEDCKAGDIVYCKVRGNCFTHLVKGKNARRGLLIGNNHGGINGWTKNVYGKVIEILPMS